MHTSKKNALSSKRNAINLITKMKMFMQITLTYPHLTVWRYKFYKFTNNP